MFFAKLAHKSRQKEDREKTHQTLPVAIQYASTAKLHTPTSHQRLQKKYAFIDIPRINIKNLTRLRMFCYSSHKIATSNKNEIT